MGQSQTYQAHAFHEQFNRGRTSGTLTVTNDEVLFESDGKQVSFPLQGSEFKLGGASDRLVYLTHPNYPDWTLYTSDRSILKNPTLHNYPLIKQQLKKAQNIRTLNWSVLFVVILVVIGAPVALLFNMDKMTGLIAHEIPVEWENELGASVYAQYKIDNKILDTEPANKHLASLTESLLSVIEEERYQYQIVIANNSDVNAFALPGGYIVINSGLILEADNASEVLGVLSHEISHVTEQHGVRNVIGTVGTFALVQAFLGDISGVMAIVANAAPILIKQSYSRGFEAEADEKGMAMLDRARIDARGMITFFEKMLKKEQQRLAEIEDDDTRGLVQDAMGFLSSHPATDERIAELKKLMKQNPLGSRNLDQVFKKLKVLVEEFVANKQEDGL